MSSKRPQFLPDKAVWVSPLWSVWFIIKQTARLLLFLVLGTPSWIKALLQLLCYILVLVPGWLRMGHYYFTSQDIVRNVEYGKGHKYRNLLDIYLPYTGDHSLAAAAGARSSPCTNDDKAHHPKPKQQQQQQPGPAPVIVFFCGGAWIIGYKLWSALIARGFSMLGYITIVPDYRNFPQGDMECMIEDASAVMAWVLSSVQAYGGDPQGITLCGQSAGAHIIMNMTLRLFGNVRAQPQQQQGRDRAANVQRMNMQTQQRQRQRGAAAVRRLDAALDSEMSNTDSEMSSPLVSASPVKLAEDGGSSGARTADADTLGQDQKEEEKEEVEGKEEVKAGKEKRGLSPVKADCVFSAKALRAIGNIILINAPADLVTLCAHCHARGLDSSILQRICHNDLDAYSPTLIVQKLAKEDADRGASTPRSQSNPSMWDIFPLVSILSCSEDRSVPISQGHALRAALDTARGVHDENGKGATAADVSASPGPPNPAMFVHSAPAGSTFHHTYVGKTHTSLIVDDPLVGDFCLCYDIHRLVSHARGRAAAAIEAEIETATANLQGTVHPILVSIARHLNPF